jgi:hypothetical protein
MTHDPFDILRRHVREVAATIEPTQTADDVIAAVMSAAPPRQLRSARRRVVGTVIVGVLVVGSGAAAAFIARGHHGRPNQGVACRSAPDLASSAQVIPLSEHPIDDCAALWSSGVLPDLDAENGVGSRPPLIACIGDSSAIEVIPASGNETCASFGLDVADVAAAVADPVSILNERLIAEINAKCLPVAVVPDIVRAMLVDLALDDWKVAVELRDGECGRAAIDDSSRTVYVIPGPTAPGG